MFVGTPAAIWFLMSLARIQRALFEAKNPAVELLTLPVIVFGGTGVGYIVVALVKLDPMILLSYMYTAALIFFSVNVYPSVKIILWGIQQIK